MVTPGAPLVLIELGSTSKFTCRNHQGGLQHAAIVEIVQEGGITGIINGQLLLQMRKDPPMVIPGVEGLRHPTFFYALIKNLLIAAICYRHLRLSYPRPGETFSIFLLLYGILRFFVEYFREQPYGWFEVGVISLSRGQLLTLPLILIGVISFLMVGRRQNS